MKNNFGKRLYELRKEKELTQRQVAQALSVSERTVSYWESGQRECSLDMLIAISAYFGVSVDFLLGKTDY